MKNKKKKISELRYSFQKKSVSVKFTDGSRWGYVGKKALYFFKLINKTKQNGKNTTKP